MSESYESQQSAAVKAATVGEFAPLRIGPLPVHPPVVLAPMAGVTNIPFRKICKQFGASLCISEMIAARPLADDNSKTWALAAFGPDETPRSIQLYGVDPYWIARAVERLVEEGHVDHIDFNFGCSVPKVTRQGGGAALPHRRSLFERIVKTAVETAGKIPVTVKFRLGLTEQHLNYLETGKIAEQCGCRAVTLHARTAEQYYDGSANWEHIRKLKEHLSIPVLGNGDIWEAADALRMMRLTGCDGVVVGRGCLGRPWLFADLANIFEGKRPDRPPNLGQVVDIMKEHLLMLVEMMGELRAVLSFRRQATWYTKGFRSSTTLRDKLVTAATLTEVFNLLDSVERAQPFPLSALRVPRGKSAGRKQLCLPDGYLENPEATNPPAEECFADGG
jgi:nifR3 family TIM-barrel protein